MDRFRLDVVSGHEVVQTSASSRGNKGRCDGWPLQKTLDSIYVFFPEIFPERSPSKRLEGCEDQVKRVDTILFEQLGSGKLDRPLEHLPPKLRGQDRFEQQSAKKPSFPSEQHNQKEFLDYV